MGNRILLWRHGQTDWNVQNKFQGHTDIPLNAIGEIQINHAAQVLAPMKPTMLIASDLDRAKKTAQALANITNHEVAIDARLRETNCGKWEGLTADEIRAIDFEALKEWTMGGDNPAGTTGDRRSEVGARARAAIEDALKGRDDELLVVATHGGTARATIGSFLDLPVAHWSKIGGLSNASWSVLTHTPKGWLLTEHNAGTIPEEVLGQDGGAVVPESVR